MATCNIQTLMNDAKCFACLGPREMQLIELWDGRGMPPQNVSVIMAPFIISRQFYPAMTPQKTRWEIVLRKAIAIATVS